MRVQLSKTDQAVQPAKGDFAIDKRGRKPRKLTPLSPEQQKMVTEVQWIAQRMAYAASTLTGGYTGSYTKADLESVGYLALCVAAIDFNPDLGISFITYAWGKVKGYIRHALRDYSRTVKLPRQVMLYRNQVKEYLDKGKSYREISLLLSIEIDEVMLCELSFVDGCCSFDYEDEQGKTTLEPIHYDDDVNYQLERKSLNLIMRLQDKDLELLNRYYDNSDTLTEAEKNKVYGILNRLKKEYRGF